MSGPGDDGDDPAPLSVVVICGGLGPERAVSLASGRAVTDALNAAGHAARRLELPDTHEDAVDALLSLEWADPDTGRPPGPFDVAFLALHGPFGEDGRVQTVLDRTGLPYTGSGVWSSLLTWKKTLAKQRWADAELPTPGWIELPAGAHEHDLEEAEKNGEEPAHLSFPYPLVVKPDAGGSSVGVSVAAGPEELEACLERAYDHDGTALLERYVAGTEWGVPVLGRDPLPPVRIRYSDGAGAGESNEAYPLFTTAAKYEDARTTFAPAAKGAEAELVAGLAVAAAEACETDGLVRVDVKVDEDGVPWVLEVNSCPGFSPRSQVPKSIEYAGFRPGDVYATACRMALGR